MQHTGPAIAAGLNADCDISSLAGATVTPQVWLRRKLQRCKTQEWNSQEEKEPPIRTPYKCCFSADP